LNNENVAFDTSLTLGNALSEIRIRQADVTVAGGIQLAYLFTAGAVPIVVHVLPLLVDCCQLYVVPVAPVSSSVPELVEEQWRWLDTLPPVGVEAVVATTEYQSE
jgi:hypothetical protein